MTNEALEVDSSPIAYCLYLLRVIGLEAYSHSTLRAVAELLFDRDKLGYCIRVILGEKKNTFWFINFFHIHIIPTLYSKATWSPASLPEVKNIYGACRDGEK